MSGMGPSKRVDVCEAEEARDIDGTLTSRPAIPTTSPSASLPDESVLLQMNVRKLKCDDRKTGWMCL